MTENPLISLESWSRFQSNHLPIAPDLIGASCEFSIEHAQIKIEIPDSKHLSDEDDDELLHVSGYETKDGSKVPNRIQVSSVDVITNLGTTQSEHSQARSGSGCRGL